jgi:hypothetical protein
MPDYSIMYYYNTLSASNTTSSYVSADNVKPSKTIGDIYHLFNNYERKYITTYTSLDKLICSWNDYPDNPAGGAYDHSIYLKIQEVLKKDRES